MEKLLALRKEKGFTQKDVADRLGISRQAYANYETGNREPDITTLIKIAQLFEVSVDELVESGHVSKTDEDDLKIALFGGDEEVTDEMWDEVKKFAEFVKAKYKK